MWHKDGTGIFTDKHSRKPLLRFVWINKGASTPDLQRISISTRSLSDNLHFYFVPPLSPTFHHTDPEKPPTPRANHKDRRWCMKCGMFPSSAQVALNVRLWSLFITSKCRKDVSITRPDVQISRVVSALTVPCLPRPGVYLRRGALVTGGSPS